MDVAIRTNELTRVFGRTVAVDRLTIDVPAGTVFGFLGPNGSGKTTTIHLLLGLIEPTGGNAIVLGFAPREQGDAIRARTGVLLEHHGLYERLSAAENLDFAGRAARLPERKRHERAKELLAHLGLWERRGEPIATWSRGMKQKLAVARALLGEPPLVFLDEPSAGLDPVAAATLRDDIKRLVAGRGTTVFLTTHDMHEAEGLCSRVAVIRNGRLLAVGSPAELRRRAAGQQVEIEVRNLGSEVMERFRHHRGVTALGGDGERITLTLADGAEVNDIVGALVDAGAAIEEVRRSGSDFQAAIVELVEGSRS